MNTKYSVVLTTYFRRFEQWLKPIIVQIKKERQDVELIVVINGEQYDDFHEDFRKDVLDFLKQFPKTFPVLFPKFRSMSFMWNNGIRLSNYENVLITQEDLTLKDGFFDVYEQSLEQSLRTNTKSFLINGSYSCFSVNKKEVIETGWFDERLLGFGHEDGEYSRRYCRLKGLNSFPSYKIVECANTIENEKLAELIQSENRLSGQTLCSQFNRYSAFNENIITTINSNGEKQYPYELFYLENKDKL